MDNDRGLMEVKKNLDLIKNDLIEVHYLMDEEGNLLQLTKLNMYILESYIRGGGRLSYVNKRLKEKYNYKIRKKRLDKLLSFKDARKYFEIRLKDLGMNGSLTKEKWIKDSIEYRDGKKIADENTRFFHKLIGQANGFFEDKSVGTQVNMQINFKQSDGT